MDRRLIVPAVIYFFAARRKAHRVPERLVLPTAPVRAPHIAST
jgi:hypothetical protein